MDYEKKYKEALSRAKDCHVNKKFSELDDSAQQLCEYIFPELKESKDERTRKALIELVKQSAEILNKKNQESMLAWLEKQSEPQPYKGNADTMRKNLIKTFKTVGSKHWGGFDVRDIIHFLESKDAIELEKQSEQKSAEYIKDEALSKLLNKVICYFINNPNISYSERDEVSVKLIPYVETLEKQGEQKSAGKIEQKFKVGDWVTDGEYTWKITDIRRLDYILQSQNGDTVDDTISYVDEHFHLWTIDDAKDGDVLASKSGCPFIYKKSDSVEARFYCCVDFENYFCVCDNTSHCGFKDSSKPATKEQHDLLFQKMKEAGYEWDAEKKELRKIDDYCQENCKGFQETGKCFADGECKAKRESEQNPVWSEEDKVMLQTTIDTLEDFSKGKLPLSDSGYNIAIAEIQWLKSLKPQSHWKSTEEQMENLEYAINMVDKCCEDSLQSLYNDLKKL